MSLNRNVQPKELVVRGLYQSRVPFTTGAETEVTQVQVRRNTQLYDTRQWNNTLFHAHQAKILCDNYVSQTTQGACRAQNTTDDKLHIAHVMSVSSREKPSL